jgi:hypothetical protein
MKIGLLIICFLFLPAQEVIAQERVSPNQTVARKIEPGKTELLSIALNDGDYVNVSIGHKGKINFFLLNPDGTIARRPVRVVLTREELAQRIPGTQPPKAISW